MFRPRVRDGAALSFKGVFERTSWENDSLTSVATVTRHDDRAHMTIFLEPSVFT